MNPVDKYHKWVQWSAEDGAYLGKCPDLITGVHGADPVTVYAELCEVVADVVRYFEGKGKALPRAKVRPMQDVA